MTSRDKAIQAALDTGIPLHWGYVAEVLDAAREAGHIRWADEVRVPHNQVSTPTSRALGEEVAERYGIEGAHDRVRTVLLAIDQRQRAGGNGTLFREGDVRRLVNAVLSDDTEVASGA
jgi:hypothetical protein